MRQIENENVYACACVCCVVLCLRERERERERERAGVFRQTIFSQTVWWNLFLSVLNFGEIVLLSESDLIYSINQEINK